MRLRLRTVFVFAVFCAPALFGQVVRRDPHIGYVYPAGAQQGSRTEILVGGQFLRGTAQVLVSGAGVDAEIVEYYPPMRNITREQRQLLQATLKNVRETRLAEQEKPDRKNGDPPPAKEQNDAEPGAMQMQAEAEKEANDAEEVSLPNHPLLRDIENKSLRELRHIADELLNYRNQLKRQRNAQLAESVLVAVTVAPDAPAGERELRLQTRFGLTNPVRFHVGWLPEERESEPNDPETFSLLPDEPPLDLPVLMNGQILPGDVDRFRVRVRAGQRLVFRTYARRLMPYLADAVPGWFQATLALFDPDGAELAFKDDTRFHPDPTLFFEVPEDGVITVEIRDAIYRGREDFVYRVEIGELPEIMWCFPLGGRQGEETLVELAGWNLPKRELMLDTGRNPRRVRQTALLDSGRLSNSIAYAVDTLPECLENEPNDSPGQAAPVDMPCIVNGRIARPGDTDAFTVRARAGDTLVAEVSARRLGSPLDSVVRILDAGGKSLAWNDDYVTREEGFLHTGEGLLTHHADSYVAAEVPADGIYTVTVSDTQGNGSQAYAYRLRLSLPRPDFALRVTPSSLLIPAGRVAVVTLHALRLDGFEGDIEVAVADSSPGFTLSGGVIPAGCDRVRMTVRAPADGLDAPVALRLEGRATVNGRTIRRRAGAADDMMQAFLYRHLAPAQELVVAVPRARWFLPPVDLAGTGPFRIAAGGRATVVVTSPRQRFFEGVELELDDPRPGVFIENVATVPTGLSFEIRVDAETVKTGFSDNLIVQTYRQPPPRKGAADKPVGATRRVPVGALPAIPVEVVCN